MPCSIIALGHEPRPITHWRRLDASDRHLIEHAELDGPDTLVLVLGPTLAQGRIPGLRHERRTVRYCNHDAAAVLADIRGLLADDLAWLHASAPAIEFVTDDRVIHRHSVVDPYRYQPCADLTLDPRWPLAALDIPRVPELDQVTPVAPPRRQPERIVTLHDAEAYDDLDDPEDPDGDFEEEFDEDDEEYEGELDEDEDEFDGEGLEDEEELDGEVIAWVRIPAVDWFDGSTSELVALSSTELGTIQRWSADDPGEVVRWDIDPDDRGVEVARWLVAELDRVLDGFPGGAQLLRLLADGTLGDRFALVHDGHDGEESFRLRLTFTATAEELTRAAAGALAWTEDGERSEGTWWVISPARDGRAKAEVALGDEG